MKGIVLAGGKGTRLYPMTKGLSKQLLPIYDKPLVYYPISVLMMAKIRDILLISSPEDIGAYQKLLGDGTSFGIKITYAVQDSPRGLADAFIIGEKFIGKDDVCLILGDNVFYGQGLSGILDKAQSLLDGAVIFGYPVSNASAFGVVEFDDESNVLSLEEKPVEPKSNFAVPGLYFYNNSVIKIAKTIKPSLRGEIEITSINNEYLAQKKLKVINLGRGMAWMDTGTAKGMLSASNFVESVQACQGLYIACLEEIAWRNDFINLGQLVLAGNEMKSCEYGQYILSIARGELKNV